ncbi:SMI1/KNR4 family protein [Myxococcaceae bacterium GXIMD 01537]
MSLQTLLEEVSRHHFPNPPATLADIAAFEQRVGWRLDPDLRAFYLHCDGGTLFKRRPDANYRFLPLAEIVRARVAFFGEDKDEDGPASMYALCDLQDGDYVLVDVARREEGRYPLVDGWHEAWPNPKHCKQLAHSFEEFLMRALSSGGAFFWLKKGDG